MRNETGAVLAPQEETLRLSGLVRDDHDWPSKASMLWRDRHVIFRVFICALVASTVIAFVIPKQYESTTRVMPPEQQSGSAAMLAAMLGKAGSGSMAALAGSLFGVKNSGALFVDLLQSGTIQGHLVDQFDLQKVYWKRYRQDAVKKLALRTEIREDRKSGVITIIVTDTDRGRARGLAQGYVDQLDQLVARVNTSAARRERQFIEQRLVSVQQDLERAQIELSEFASKNTTLDIKEQTRAMVEAGAKLQAQLIVAQSEVGSLEQIYTSENIRVRAAQARVSELQRELNKMGRSSMQVGDGQDRQGDNSAFYPPLRQLPILGVRWADLYRRVKIQETVFDLLTEQYETARIEEAKSIPIVSVIDPAGWPEKKSFPPRLLIIVLATAAAVIIACAMLLFGQSWQQVSPTDSRKILLQEIAASCRSRAARLPLPHFRTDQ